ncbi:MAG: hypothetical protein K8J08_01695, partial [Thermoanaerobaculia bacterium]|nr:hypothetical protein [Thermoanaerobaculia bacterium]
AADLGLLLYFAGRHDEAAAQYRQVEELAPGFAYAAFGDCLNRVALGTAEQGVARLRRAGVGGVGADVDGDPLLLGALGHALAVSGNRDEAHHVLAALTALPEATSGHQALVLAALGRPRHALDALFKACQQRSRFVVFLDEWPAFDSLRAKPSYSRLPIWSVPPLPPRGSKTGPAADPGRGGSQLPAYSLPGTFRDTFQDTHFETCTLAPNLDGRCPKGRLRRGFDFGSPRKELEPRPVKLRTWENG